MTAVRRVLSHPIVVPIVVFLILPAVASVSSWVATGHALAWTTSIQLWVWTLIAGLVAGLLIAGGVSLSRRRGGTNVAVALSGRSGGYGFGWEHCGRMEHAGVIWEMYAPRAGIAAGGGVVESEAEPELPPRCPRCRTKLEEIASRRGFVWRCPEGDYSAKSSDGVRVEAARAAVRYQRWLEAKAEERPAQS